MQSLFVNVHESNENRRLQIMFPKMSQKYVKYDVGATRQ